MIKLLNERCPSNYYWILLQDNVEGSLPQVKLWSTFYQEDKKSSFELVDNPVINFATYLLKTAEEESQVIDSYDQLVNLGEYNPNYMRVEQDFAAGFLPENSPPYEEKIINTTISEKMRLKKAKASFEAWEYKLINAYRYLKAQAKDNIISSMSSYLWDTYLGKLMLETTSKHYGEGKAAELQASMDKGTTRSSLRLDRLKIWRDNSSWKYKDMVSLCKLGIPKELRPTIWSELFGLSGSRNPDFEKNKRAAYNNYVVKSISEYSIVFKQIEEDVKDLTATNVLNENEFERKERPLILKIAKAYYAWCLEENKKTKTEESKGGKKDDPIKEGNKENQFIYFKGILHLIQKVSKVFDEAETFWCIVGFANALPYLFKSQKIMTASLAWNHKLLLLAISTIMEVKYPAIYEAIIKHGLPLDYYISDKVFSLLSTVFNTETLLRLYDVIALEAGSKEPIRAMWVILTGCIMLMTLNEVYIKSARSADEISLIINNTGINKLNTQKITEELYNLNGELLTTYNPTWEKFLAMAIDKKDSAKGLEQAWTEKASKLETHYSRVRDLNKQMEDIIGKIRGLVPENKITMDDDYWMNDFVRRFCKYYGDYARKEVPNTVNVYVYKCCNLPEEAKRLSLTYGSDDPKFMDVQDDGTVDRMEEFLTTSDMTIKLIVEGAESRSCTIDLANYETDMPITVDLPLHLRSEGEGTTGAQKPQPFVSLVLLLVTKGEEGMDDEYKCMKDCMLAKSTIISTINKPAKKKGVDSFAKFKATIKNKLKDAGLKSIYVPGAKAITTEETKVHKDTKESDMKALLHMFTLVKYQVKSFYGNEMPESGEEVREIAQKIYNEFSKYYSGNLPLKRVVISLIVASSLTIDKKLSYFYNVYTSLIGSGESERGQNCFLLDDIIELVQLLCELHLVYISPEYIPQLVEQVMTKGGINRITKCYLVSAAVSKPDKIAKVLMNKNLKKTADTEDVIDVTKAVHSVFVEYWERWEHKQVFTADPTSFCSTLKEILKGSGARPKHPGPYSLVICYRHNGEAFYKVLEYDEREKLKLPRETKNDMLDLLVYCRNNFSFVGERMKMDKDEFLYRMKRIPLLTELMRLQLASKTLVPVTKTRKDLRVNIMNEDNRIAVVNFVLGSEEDKDDFENQEGEIGTKKYDFSSTPCTFKTLRAHKEDLIVEIKERIFAEINNAIDDVVEKYHYVRIPEELYPHNLNHSLKLFANYRPLDDYLRLESISESTLELRRGAPDEGNVETKNILNKDVNDYAFHVHGDYSSEWVKCPKVEKRGKNYSVETVLLPEVLQQTNRHYLLLAKKGE